MRIIRWIRMFIFKQQAYSKIKEAIERSVKEKRKCLVVVMDKRPEVYTKQELKKMVRKKQVDYTIQEIEKRAIYITGE